MPQSVNSILADRPRQYGSRQRVASLVAAVLLHVAVVSAVALAGRLTASPPPPLEYVAVEVVPAQALGVRRPPPRPESKPEPVMPEPTPPPQEKEPAPEPEKTATPPVEEPKPSEKQEEPRPTAVPEPPAAPSTRPGSPQGSPLGTSAFGAEVASLDNPSFTYTYYLDRMLALIESQWVRPPLGGEVKAVVHFKIARQGRVTDLRLVESSGYNSFDLSALRAVQNAAPLPPLPASYRHDSLGVTLIVR